jgi:RNA 2',3'-cyclic 3'-phosphodiesterase
METIRAFIAVELTADVKVELSIIEFVLKKASDYSVRWVNPDSIHLTLCFLGDIQEAQMATIQKAIDRTAACFNVFELRLGKPGAFPNILNPQIIWVGLEGDLPRLAEMQGMLARELRPAGYKPENRPFSPHLTIARTRPGASTAGRQKMADALVRSTETVNPVVTVKAISLMKSRLTTAGAVHTRLSLAGLKC